VSLRPPRWLLRPLLAGLALRLAALFLAPSVPILGDSMAYVFLGRELRDQGRFSDPEGGVRPPLEPALVALGLGEATAGDPIEPGVCGAFPGVYLVQIVADLLALVLLARLAMRLFGERAGAATGWLHALLPSAVLYASTVVMAESVALLCGAAAVERLQALDRALSLRTRAWLPAALGLGAALGAGLLAKELGMLVALAGLLAVLLRPGVSVARRAAGCGLACLTLLAVTAPWAVRNLERHGLLLPTGSFGHVSVVVDNAPPGESGWLLLQQDKSLAARIALSHDILRRELFEYPALTAQRALARLRMLLGPEAALPAWLASGFDGYQADARSNLLMVRDAWHLRPGVGRTAQLLASVTSVLLFACAAAGLLLAGPGSLRRATLLLAVGLVISSALTVAEARYRLALLPFALPFAGLAVATLLDPAARAAADPRRMRSARRAGLITGALLAVTILTLPPP